MENLLGDGWDPDFSHVRFLVGKTSLQQASLLVALDPCIIAVAKYLTGATSEGIGPWLKDTVHHGGRRQQWEHVQSYLCGLRSQAVEWCHPHVEWPLPPQFT